VPWYFPINHQAHLPEAVPFSHLTVGEARQLFGAESGHIEDENEAVDLNILVSLHANETDRRCLYLLFNCHLLAAAVCRT